MVEDRKKNMCLRNASSRMTLGLTTIDMYFSIFHLGKIPMAPNVSAASNDEKVQLS